MKRILGLAPEEWQRHWPYILGGAVLWELVLLNQVGDIVAKVSMAMVGCR